jgi:glucosylceramidase
LYYEEDNLEAIELELVVNQTVTYQPVMGFGGAFSDAVGILLSSLNPKARMELLNAYFHRKNGLIVISF